MLLSAVQELKTNALILVHTTELLYQTVEPGGALVVQFQYLNEDRMGRRWPIFLDLVQLCITEHGRNHTVGETRRWMEEAGYRDIEFSAMSLLNSNGYMRGYRPGLS